jgi:hypothetical protein
MPVKKKKMVYIPNLASFNLQTSVFDLLQWQGSTITGVNAMLKKLIIACNPKFVKVCLNNFDKRSEIPKISNSMKVINEVFADIIKQITVDGKSLKCNGVSIIPLTSKDYALILNLVTDNQKVQYFDVMFSVVEGTKQMVIRYTNENNKLVTLEPDFSTNLSQYIQLIPSIKEMEIGEHELPEIDEDEEDQIREFPELSNTESWADCSIEYNITKLVQKNEKDLVEDGHQDLVSTIKTATKNYTVPIVCHAYIQFTSAGVVKLLGEKLDELVSKQTKLITEISQASKGKIYSLRIVKLIIRQRSNYSSRVNTIITYTKGGQRYIVKLVSRIENVNGELQFLSYIKLTEKGGNANVQEVSNQSVDEIINLMFDNTEVVTNPEDFASDQQPQVEDADQTAA